MTYRALVVAAVLAGLGLLSAPSGAQQGVSVKPNAGQSQAQTQKDIADCQAIAQQSASSASGGEKTRGGRLRGAAVGAAAGAARAEVQGQQHAGYDRLSDDVKQDYRRNQAEGAAAAGAMVGGARQRQQRRSARAAAAEGSTDAYVGCLQGRGYTVTQ
jgi:hypothetical protein